MTATQPGSPIPATEGEAFIRDSYALLLRRAPDQDGMAAHLLALEKGVTRERLFYEIRVSPEGCKEGVAVTGLHIGTIRASDLLRQDGAAFVDAVYLALLGRTPGDGEMAANMLTLSRQVSRETVIASVAASPEAAAFGASLTGLTRAKALRKAKNAIRRIPGVAKVLDSHRGRVQPIDEGPAKQPLSSRLRAGKDNLVHINRLAQRVENLEQSQELNELRNQVESLRGELRLRDVMREHRDSLSTNLAYKRFEDEMRGSREEISARLRAYDSIVETARERCGEPMFALDLGCGRGEWLELMAARGITALGVDTDPTMLLDCEARGFMTLQADLLTCLKNRLSASVDIVTLFQVAEHLPISVLLDTLTECQRVLRPGGALIVETPNPENLIVGACNFSMDPTHVTRLPPPLLKILVEGAGFEEAEILRLHPYGAIPAEHLADAPEAVQVMAGFFNQCADYAVTAFKGR